MPRSLLKRLITILGLLAAAAVVSGFVMFALFEQSTAARIGQAGATAEQACDGIARAYRFYTTEWQGGPPNVSDPELRRSLEAVVFTALSDKTSIEGGLWQADAGAFAYAFPTYEGSGPKTDIPQAELPRIGETVKAAAADDRAQLTRIDAGTQSLLIAACPLPGPIAGLTAWTMTRVHSLGGSTYWQLMAGLAVLFGSVTGATVMAASLALTWSRHVRRIEASLGRQDGDLPVLALTGEKELDRVVEALNDAGRRLRAARIQAELLGRAAAQSERLAAVGRVAAGVAHEIRSPIAAMRLKAETALTRDPGRKDRALQVVIDQVDRLDHLVNRVLAASEPEPLRLEDVALQAFLEACAARKSQDAISDGARITIGTDVTVARFDPDRMARAMENLISNALQATPAGVVRVTAAATGSELVLAVTDDGIGPPETIRDHLFDPFVTGRPEGAGLGLSIVREVAEAHGGTADFDHCDGATTFRITIPCPAS